MRHFSQGLAGAGDSSCTEKCCGRHGIAVEAGCLDIRAVTPLRKHLSLTAAAECCSVYDRPPLPRKDPHTREH